MLAAIGDDPILWVNVKTLEPTGEWSNEQMQLWNQALVEAAARYPNIEIYDWAAVVQDAWFQEDRIHYTSPGNVRARPPDRRRPGCRLPGLTRPGSLPHPFGTLTTSPITRCSRRSRPPCGPGSRRRSRSRRQRSNRGGRRSPPASTP